MFLNPAKKSEEEKQCIQTSNTHTHSFKPHRSQNNNCCCRFADSTENGNIYFYSALLLFSSFSRSFVLSMLTIVCFFRSSLFQPVVILICRAQPCMRLMMATENRVKSAAACGQNAERTASGQRKKGEK